MKTFKEFANRKERQSKKQLKIVKKLLESQGLQVKDHLDDDDPYLFLQKTNDSVSFGGIRIYKIGEQMAFRIQKQESTHPFGQAYPINIEEMFNDLMNDHHKPEEAGKQVIKYVVEEVKRFFDKTAEAEKDLKKCS